jgi:hypothetical protein
LLPKLLLPLFLKVFTLAMLAAKMQVIIVMAVLALVP